MRITLTVKKALGLLAILLSVGLVRAQKASTPALPIGDEQAKQAWINAHPDAYRQMGGQIPQGNVATQQTPVKAQADVADKPMTETEKQAWIQANPANYQMLNNGQSPMPWGDPSNKAAWIQAHPREYAAMTADNRIRVTRAEFDALPANRRQAMLNDPKYVIIDTPVSTQ